MVVYTRKRELAALHTKSKIATTAQLLQKLDSSKEKLEWAIDTKNEGNQLFNSGDYKSAIEKYVEALTATNFGADGNTQELAIPVLCNLCLCCIRLEEWQKCTLFADQALKIDRSCEKAIFRKGLSLIKLGEFDDAIQILKSIDIRKGINCNETQDDLKNEEKTWKLSDRDRQRIPQLLKEAFNGRKRHREILSRQKESLQRAFGSKREDAVVAAPVEELKPMSFIELVLFAWECVVKLFIWLLRPKNKIKSA